MLVKDFVKNLIAGESRASASSGSNAEEFEAVLIRTNQKGVLYVIPVSTSGQEITGRAPADNIDPADIFAEDTNAYLYAFDGTNFDRLRSIIDGDASAPVGLLGVINRPQNFNGTDYDRQRNNEAFEVLPSAARTATNNSSDFTNYNSRGLHIAFDVTAVSGTGSVTPVIQGLDPSSGKYYDLLVGPTVTATGLNIIKLYPGIVASANASASDILPRTWRVEIRHADASSYTYSVGANVVN